MRDSVIVVGLGAVGSATLYQLARRGVPAVGIDRYAPPHAMGSSHGETRITRQAVGEGESYAPLVRRSHEIWRTLEAEEGVALLDQVGGLIMAPREGAALHHGKDSFVRRTVAVAERFGIAHEVLDPAAIMRRFPQFQLRGDELGYFEPGAGMVAPERCIAAQLAAARRLGATVRVDERVLAITQDGGGVTVRSDRETLTANRCVVTAGPWIGELLGGGLKAHAVPYRQALHWFEADDPAAYAPGRFPVFIWMHGPAQEDYLYGFPQVAAGTGVKVATEQYADPADPDAIDRTVSEAESAEMFRLHVAGRLRGVTPRRLRAAACLYTVTPDAAFIVDAPPGLDRVLAVSACSGHGFKHSAALGEAVAEQVADGGSAIDLATFRAGRLQAAE